MKWTEGPNDYAMLQEMLRRRFAQARDEQERLGKDEPVKPKWSILPDLILIDGGKGQLSAAREVLFEYNQSIPAIGLAKQRELVFTPDRPGARAGARPAAARTRRGAPLRQRLSPKAAGAADRLLRARRHPRYRGEAQAGPDPPLRVGAADPPGFRRGDRRGDRAEAGGARGRLPQGPPRRPH